VSGQKEILPRLAVVLSHPTQYYSPWFQWLRSNTSMEFRVFYLWDFGVTSHVDPKFGTQIKWDVDLMSGYDSEFVANKSESPGAESFFGFNNPDIVRQLSAWRPQAVLLYGYKWATHIKVIAWARWAAVPILFRGDSNLLGRPSPSLHVLVALRLLFAQMAAFLYVGLANRDYFEKFGAPGRKLFFTPHSVNAAHYNQKNESSTAEAALLRRSLGLAASTRVVLFAGKLIPAKQPMALLRAFLALNVEDSALVFVGEGSEKERLIAAAEETSRPPGKPSVHFLPFANQSEMPARYLAADLFVLPSEGTWETWGLAVNEAMHMGVPCIVSDRVGCQRDLVINGETGWVFESSDPDSLRRALCAALAEIGSPRRREEIQGAVARKISGYTYEKSAEGLLEALRSLPG
jgi:glycosyltransferase involved in cell wall biosynthesis